MSDQSNSQGVREHTLNQPDMLNPGIEDVSEKDLTAVTGGLFGWGKQNMPPPKKWSGKSLVVGTLAGAGAMLMLGRGGKATAGGQVVGGQSVAEGQPVAGGQSVAGGGSATLIQ